MTSRNVLEPFHHSHNHLKYSSYEYNEELERRDTGLGIPIPYNVWIGKAESAEA
ncbi:hypothetical protein M378DRAFT_162184 [Amanita muscaria Koide BX008]|uniref:Uncharacterized protein n=1 Tax=Amanita muscaria (strain Koide BX008) TaxID=946122 RepID=A0A0C2X902_AMAMK|nr:hypothetical protein M378DRAFT_162184 [Amanita muscaria Koide BX008]